jgi:hypothetical protein
VQVTRKKYLSWSSFPNHEKLARLAVLAVPAPLTTLTSKPISLPLLISQAAFCGLAQYSFSLGLRKGCYEFKFGSSPFLTVKKSVYYTSYSSILLPIIYFLHSPQ